MGLLKFLYTEPLNEQPLKLRISTVHHSINARILLPRGIQGTFPIAVSYSK